MKQSRVSALFLFAIVCDQNSLQLVSALNHAKGIIATIYSAVDRVSPLQKLVQNELVSFDHVGIGPEVNRLGSIVAIQTVTEADQVGPVPVVIGV